MSFILWVFTLRKYTARESVLVQKLVSWAEWESPLHENENNTNSHAHWWWILKGVVYDLYPEIERIEKYKRRISYSIESKLFFSPACGDITDHENDSTKLYVINWYSFLEIGICLVTAELLLSSELWKNGWSFNTSGKTEYRWGPPSKKKET